jgi:hypothetical protein
MFLCFSCALLYFQQVLHLKRAVTSPRLYEPVLFRGKHLQISQLEILEAFHAFYGNASSQTWDVISELDRFGDFFLWFLIMYCRFSCDAINPVKSLLFSGHPNILISALSQMKQKSVPQPHPEIEHCYLFFFPPKGIGTNSDFLINCKLCWLGRGTDKSYMKCSYPLNETLNFLGYCDFITLFW